jgi:hypothetical protein
MKFAIPLTIHISAIALSVALAISVYLKALGGSFSTGPARYGEFSQNVCLLVLVLVCALAALAFALRSQATLFGIISLVVIVAGYITVENKAKKVAVSYSKQRSEIESQADQAFAKLPREFIHSKPWPEIKSSILFLDRESSMYLRADLQYGGVVLFCVAKLIDGVAHFNLADDDKSESVESLEAFYSEYLSQSGQSFVNQYKLRVVSNDEFMAWPCPIDKYTIKPGKF